MPQIFALPKQIPLSSSGALLPGAKLYFYQAGTTTYQNVYQDIGLTTPHNNPLVADGNGVFPAIYLNPNAPANYKVKLTTSAEVEVYTQDNVPDGGLFPRNAGEIAAGVTPTNYDYLPGNVKRYGAKGDGTTDDTSAINSAITYCNSVSEVVEWPAGTYLTSSTPNPSIPNLHNVRHSGAGVIKRGADLFYISPSGSQTNNIYVATTGNDANDGLSASEPLATAQKAGDILAAKSSALEDGIWKVRFAAGTYTLGQGTQYFLKLTNVESKTRLYFVGPDVGGHPNVPTAIFDSAPNAIDNRQGFVFAEEMFVWVQDVKFKNFTAGTLGTAVAATYGTNLYCKNVHVDNCGWNGLLAQFNCQLNVDGGIVENCRYGVNNYSNSNTTLSSPTSDRTGGVVIRNCTAAGVLNANAGEGHVDWATIDACIVGIELDTNSRFHVKGCDIKNNTTAGLQLRGASQWYNDPLTPNTFAANGTIAYYYGGSLETDSMKDRTTPMLCAVNTASTPHTGTTAPTSVKGVLFTTPMGWLKKAGANKLRVCCAGIFTNTTATASIALGVGGSPVSVLSLNAPAASLSGHPFVVEWMIYAATGGGSRGHASLVTQSQVGKATAGATTAAIDEINPQNIEIFVTLGNAADTVTVYEVEVELWGA